MKKLLLVIVLISSLFADTIKYKSSIFIEDTKENVEFLGVSDNKVYFKYPNDKIEYVSCRTVKEILDFDGNVINIDCSSNAYTPPKESSFSQSKGKVKRKAVQYNKARISHKIGGGLIALGGLFLYNTWDRAECEGCTSDERDDRMDSVKIQAKFGYGLIISGGLIIAIGK